MPGTRIRIGSLPRGEPLPDEGEGERLRDLLLGALSRGPAPPAAVVLRERRLDLLELAHARVASLHTLLAGLTRSVVPDGSAVEAVGLVGVFAPSPAAAAPEPARSAAGIALAFLEWEDGRWWSWRAAALPGGGVREDTVTVGRAVDGDRLPDGLGRWWSLGRRARMRLELWPAPDGEDLTGTSALVH